MEASETEEEKFTYYAVFREASTRLSGKWNTRKSETRELAERVRIGIATDDEVEHFRRLRRIAVRNAGITTLCVAALTAILMLY